MSDNYAVINGKRIELTDEQVKTLEVKRKQEGSACINQEVLNEQSTFKQ